MISSHVVLCAASLESPDDVQLRAQVEKIVTSKHHETDIYNKECHSGTRVLHEMAGTSEEMLRCFNCHQTCTQKISVCRPDIWHYFTIGNVSKEAWLAASQARDEALEAPSV